LFGHYLKETAQLINKVLGIDFGDPNYDPPKFNLYVLIHRERGGSRIPHPLGWG